MNVLATGMNPADANALKRKPRVDLFQVFPEIVKVLKAEGDNVVWRRLRVGVPMLPRTGAILISMMLPRSLNCPYAFSAVWTISEALRLDLPLVLYFTDWAFYNAHVEFRSILREGKPYFYKQMGGFPQYPESEAAIEENAEALLEVCRQYGDPQSKLWQKAAVVAPMYTNWGNKKIVQRLLPGANPVHRLDPTPPFLRYLDEYGPATQPSDIADREKRWILPSLLKTNTWMDDQKLQWPVDRFGPKGYDVLAHEGEVNRQYGLRVGAICPPYPTAGSGWWRSRWIHAARAQSVLLCGSMDDDAAGRAYRFNGEQYESMSDARLRRAAMEQQETMYEFLQKDWGVFRDQVYAPFREAGA